MGRNDRAIKVAYDPLTQSSVTADDMFRTYKTAFELRAQIQLRQKHFYCCECEQPLTVSASKYDRIYFKHFPGHDPCILTDGNLTPQEIENFARIQIAKESQRHIFLKNEIARKLKMTEGIEIDSIAIDNKFIVKGHEKRRPDVFCRYNGKDLVFEIQLSNLSLRYIRSRYDFYKENGIYLIWILDNFDLHDQSQMVRDIKYLAPHQNFFKLDERAESFNLICDYKEPYVTKEKAVQTKWQKTSVALSQIKFDENACQIYYFDFTRGLKEKELELAKALQQELLAKNNRLKEIAEHNAQQKADGIIKKIASLKQQNAIEYENVKEDISNLNSFELQVLNNALGFIKPARLGQTITRWIRETTPVNKYFLYFILGCEEINLDLEERNVDGATVFLEACKNDSVTTLSVAIAIFHRGYKLTDDDKAYIDSEIIRDSATGMCIYLFMDKLHDRSLVGLAWKKAQVLYIIESAKLGRIFGFGYKQHEWIAFANNAISNYGKYWEYIEYAFKYYGLWKKLILQDRKGTFQRKLDALYSNMPEQEYNFDPLFKDLYPEMANESLV